jgi:hypothetical protein
MATLRRGDLVLAAMTLMLGSLLVPDVVNATNDDVRAYSPPPTPPPPHSAAAAPTPPSRGVARSQLGGVPRSTPTWWCGR